MLGEFIIRLLVVPLALLMMAALGGLPDNEPLTFWQRVLAFIGFVVVITIPIFAIYWFGYRQGIVSH